MATRSEKSTHVPKKEATLSKKQTELPKKQAIVRGKNGGAREGAGRKEFQPTENERKQVEALSGYGLPFEQIAALIRDSIHVDTLRKYFSAELVNGKAKANAQIGKSIFQKAMAGDTTAAIWWSKSQMKWSETVKNEHTGANGGAIAMASVDFKGLSDAELAQMQTLMMKAKGGEE